MTDTRRRPLLLLTCGNPSRGDDALGPELARQFELSGRFADHLEVLTDFQLQIEHALDLVDRRLVVFADASLDASAPFEFTPLGALADNTYTTHSMSPAAVLDVYRQVQQAPLPACHLLSIRGYAFALGQPITPQAKSNLQAATTFLERFLLDQR
jgi:hydrogenase maturation protease